MNEGDRSVEAFEASSTRRRERARAERAQREKKTKLTWHLTSMKNEFGACTKRLSLCLEASNSAGGFNRSMS